MQIGACGGCNSHGQQLLADTSYHTGGMVTFKKEIDYQKKKDENIRELRRSQRERRKEEYKEHNTELRKIISVAKRRKWEEGMK